MDRNIAETVTVAFLLGSALGIEYSRNYLVRCCHWDFIGGWFFSQAFMGACAVLISNTVLRPLSLRINQQPTEWTELEFYYLCSLVCRGDEEAHVRILLLHALGKMNKIKLRSLRSQDLDDFNNLVEVEAQIIAQNRDDNSLEQIISRLSLEPVVKSVSWRILEQDYDE